MILCGTGHRPNKLGGYTPTAHKRLIDIAEYYLLQIKPEQVISGMALGWDTALAEATLKLSIPLTCAVPFIGQEAVWPIESIKVYESILKQSKIVIVSEGSYSPAKMQKRNKWMVDNSELVLAIWDGSAGGTGNCIQYAKSSGKRIVNAYSRFVYLLTNNTKGF